MAPSVASTASILPADRLTKWQPGVTYNTVPGLSTPGIPARPTIFTTVNPTGVASTDVAAIQAAVDTCPDGQTVLLGVGTFAFDGTSNTTSGPIFVGKNNKNKITVRGSGPGVTILSKTNGSQPEPGQGTGPNPSCCFQIDPNPNNCGYNGVPPSPWDTPGGNSSALQAGGVNLTQDGTHGAMSVTVADASNFSAGMYVNLDELSGSQWMPDTVTYNAAVGYQIWASPDYKTTWKCHWPTIAGVDDFFGDNLIARFSGSVMTVDFSEYSRVAVGQVVNYAGVPANVTISSFGTGGGGTGTYNLSQSVATVGGTITATASFATSIMTVTGSPSGTITPGMVVSGTGLNFSANITIQPYGTGGTSGTGGAGTYALNFSVGTVGSGTVTCGLQCTTTNLPYQAGTTGDFADTRLDRSHCEVKEIASVVGNVITFTSPIHGNYRVANTAQLTYYTDAAVTQKVAFIVGCGVENLTIKGFDANCISMSHAAYCWAQQIECDQWAGQCFSQYSCFRCEYRRFWVHGATYPRPTSGAYNWTLDAGSSEALFEDYISILGNKAMTSRRSGAGSVVGYGYADMGMIDYTGLPSWIEIGVNGSHLGGSHHMLFEGNWSWNGDSDNTHGPSVYHTYFRNWFTGFRSQFVDPLAVTTTNASFSGSTMTVSAAPSFTIFAGMTVFASGVGAGVTILPYGTGGTSGTGGTGTYALSASVGTIGGEAATFQNLTINDAAQSSNGPFRCGAGQDYSYWMSFAGNVLGTSGQMGGWVTSRTFGQNVAGIWMLGWCSGFDTTPSVDPQIVNGTFAGQVFRNGNWDWLNSQQFWYNTPPTVIPSSLYITNGAPPFFLGNTWPWVDPSTGNTYTLPAKARYATWVANGTPNPAA